MFLELSIAKVDFYFFNIRMVESGTITLGVSK